MQKLKPLLFSGILFLTISNVFGQSWIWGSGDSSPSTNGQDVLGVAADKKGNAFITGTFGSGSIVFGNDTLNSSNVSADLVKFNSAGNPVWARQVNDITSTSYGGSVATDKTGNIYMFGTFRGTAKIGAYSLASHDYNDNNVYLAKYNANGNVLWAKQSVTPTMFSSGDGYSVTTDKFGNVFVAGSFQDTISFGSFTLREASPSNNTYEAFLVKYDSNGNVLWAKQTTSNTFWGAAESTGGIATDSSGNSYFIGSFSDSIYFGATLLVGDRATNSFIAKYSPSGNLIWVKNSVNSSTKCSCQPYSAVTDRANNIYISGSFRDTVKFGTHSLYSTAYNSVFLTKYDSNGNAIWAEKSSPNWMGSSLASDTTNHIYLTGYDYEYLNILSFGSFSLSVNPATRYSYFLLKFDTNGEAICGSLLYTPDGGGTSMASDHSGTYIYMAGTFDTTLYSGSDTILSKNWLSFHNPFVARWQNCAVDAGINEVKAQTANVILFPNPSNGQYTLESSVVSDKSTVEVYNMLGEMIYSNTLSINNSTLSIDISNNANGIYLYRVIANTGELIGEGKLIIQK
jgi:hypothetical protein